MARVHCISSSTNTPCFLLTLGQCRILLDCGADMSPLCHYAPAAPNISGILKASNANSSTPTHTINLGTNPYLVSSPFLHLPQLLSLPGLVANTTPINAIDDISADVCESVDAIFISNQHSMWALPALLKRFRVRAKVLTTKATKHFGRMLIDEFHSLIADNPSVSRSAHWSFAYSLGLRNALCEPCYTAAELQSCWSQVQTVSFNEPIALSPLLTVRAFSSGWQLGSCGWDFQINLGASHSQMNDDAHANSFRFVYLSGASGSKQRHTKQLETDYLYRNSTHPPIDVLLLSSLSLHPTLPLTASLHRCCQLIIETVKQNGSVLLPVQCSAVVVMDLLEHICASLVAALLLHITVYFISPSAERALTAADALSEWMFDSRQQRTMQSKPPTPFQELRKRGLLKVCSGLSDPIWTAARHSGLSATEPTAKPCIVLAPHPSLRFGPALQLLPLFAANANNMLMLTDPDTRCANVMKPFDTAKLLCRVVEVPLDARLSYLEANALLSHCSSAQVLLPKPAVAVTTSEISIGSVPITTQVAELSTGIRTDLLSSGAVMSPIDSSVPVSIADEHVKRNPPVFHAFDYQDIIDLHPLSSTPRASTQPVNSWWWENVAAVASALPATVQHVRDAISDAMDRAESDASTIISSVPVSLTVRAAASDGYAVLDTSGHVGNASNVLYGTATVLSVLHNLSKLGVNDASVHIPPSASTSDSSMDVIDSIIQVPSLHASIEFHSGSVRIVVDSEGFDNDRTHTVLDQAISAAVSASRT